MSCCSGIPRPVRHPWGRVFGMTSNEESEAAARPRRRLGTLWRWVVLVLWLGLAVVMSPLAGKLTGAEKNDLASALPPAADSTREVRASSGFADGDRTTAVIVYARESGLTAADRAQVDSSRRELGRLAGSAVPAAAASADGKALLLTASLPSDA